MLGIVIGILSWVALIGIICAAFNCPAMIDAANDALDLDADGASKPSMLPPRAAPRTNVRTPRILART